MTTGISLGSSGLDIDSLVTKSVTTYQNKYNKAYKAEQKVEWKKSAYADIYSALKTFKDTASDYKLSSNTIARTVSSSSTAITATANGDAAEMSHTVSVSQLATSAYLQTASGQKASTTVGGVTSTKLSDVAGVDTTAGADSDTALSFTITDGETTKTISYTYLQLKGGTDANGKTIAAKTLTDFASDIKSAGLNVTATYDTVNDSFSLFNSKTGSANKVQVTLDASSGTTTTAGTNADNLFKALHLASYNGSTLTDISSSYATTLYSTSGVAGTNAQFTVDGKSYDTSSNKNTINGVIYSFNDVTNATNATATTVGATTTYTSKLTVSTDTDALVKKVQAFVDSYNKALAALNDQTHATQYSNYEALTDDEKTDMSDTQIEKWEEKAKSGLLKNDSMLTKIVSSMRSAISNEVDGIGGDYSKLSKIGITTQSYTEYGQLHLDTDTLKKAIAADPNSVYDLFSTKGTDSDTNGVAYRLYDIVNEGMKSVSDQAGTSASTTDTSYLGVKITKMKSNLDDLSDLLSDKKDYFYNKYNAMEEALSKIQSQASTLSSYLGS